LLVQPHWAWKHSCNKS